MLLLSYGYARTCSWSVSATAALSCACLEMTQSAQRQQTILCTAANNKYGYFLVAYLVASWFCKPQTLL